MAEEKEIKGAQTPLTEEELTKAAEEISASVEREAGVFDAPSGEQPTAINMSEDNAPKKKAPPKKKHTVRNVILLVIAAAVIALIVWGCMKFFGGGNDQGEIMHAYVDIGSITSTVSGEGLTRAKNSANMTLTTSGTVQEVYVKEGDQVEAGGQLYKIKSEAA